MNVVTVPVQNYSFQPLFKKPAPVNLEISLQVIEQAKERIRPYLPKTPLLESKTSHGFQGLFLKCENLQKTKSFKVRGALNSLLFYQKCDPFTWRYIQKNGVISCSSGNFATSLAWVTKLLDVPFSVVVHEYTDKSKIANIQKWNSQTKIIVVSLESWKKVMISNQYSKSSAFFISGETNPHSLAGNATLMLEILEEEPDLQQILIPYGGGGLTYAVSSVLKQKKTEVKIFAVEVETGTPLTTSLSNGEPTTVPYQPSFVDGIGADFVIPSLFNKVKDLVDGSLVVSLQQVKDSLRTLLIQDNLLAEGAGVASFAACLHLLDPDPEKKVGCILSGGNLDFQKILPLL